MERGREGGREVDSLPPPHIHVYRYTPVRLHLAVHELDEKHVGRFSFRSDENIRKVSAPFSPGLSAVWPLGPLQPLELVDDGCNAPEVTTWSPLSPLRY